MLWSRKIQLRDLTSLCSTSSLVKSVASSLNGSGVPPGMFRDPRGHSIPAPSTDQDQSSNDRNSHRKKRHGSLSQTPEDSSNSIKTCTPLKIKMPQFLEKKVNYPLFILIRFSFILTVYKLLTSIYFLQWPKDHDNQRLCGNKNNAPM